MKALILITTLWAVTMVGSANGATSLGKRIDTDEVRQDFRIAALETMEGRRLLAKHVLVDGLPGLAVSAKQLLQSGQIESIRSGEILYPEEIKYLFNAKATKRAQWQQAPRRGKRPVQQIGRDDDVNKEPHGDGWPINNGGRGGGRK